MPITHTTVLPLKFGEFTIAYHRNKAGTCVSVSRGDLKSGAPIVRIHSSCLFGESFHGLDCDCAAQLESTFKLIKRQGSGVIIYSYAEGRGIGLEKKIAALELQRTKRIDTVEAFRQLGFGSDLRNYTAEILALNELQVSSTIKAATQNPSKLAALRDGGYQVVEQLHPKIRLTKYNVPELLTKKQQLGYNILQSLNAETT